MFHGRTLCRRRKVVTEKEDGRMTITCLQVRFGERLPRVSVSQFSSPDLAVVSKRITFQPGTLQTTMGRNGFAFHHFTLCARNAQLDGGHIDRAEETARVERDDECGVTLKCVRSMC
jgi:hypothetical protein